PPGDAKRGIAQTLRQTGRQDQKKRRDVEDLPAEEQSLVDAAMPQHLRGDVHDEARIGRRQCGNTVVINCVLLFVTAAKAQIFSLPAVEIEISTGPAPASCG